MRLLYVTLLILAMLPYDSFSQAPFTDHELLQAPTKERRPGLPIVDFDYQNQFKLRSMFPDYYDSEQKIARDIRWVMRNDSVFLENWDIYGDSILGLIEDYSGIKWLETTIRVHPVKYSSSDGSYNPIVLPLYGIKKKHYDEAIPTGWHQTLNMIKYFSGRNLMQTDLPGKARMPIADHPLLQNTAFRFETIALTLALRVAKDIIPPDSLDLIVDTEIWSRHNRGWAIYENMFKNNWDISADSTLLFFMTEEPFSSPLVKATRPPRPPKAKATTTITKEQIRLGAGEGRLGFSVIKNDRKYLEIVDIDSLGLAFLSGLRIGDQIKRVDGVYSRSARDLMGKILDKVDTDGVYLLYVREGKESGLLMMQPAEEYNPIDDIIE